jgi:hypothetical protein
MEYKPEDLIAKSTNVLEDIPPAKIIFQLEGQPPLVLTKDGFIYMGKVVEDTGVAYELFCEWLRCAMASA